MAVGGAGLVMMGTSIAASAILGPAGPALYGVGWLFTTGAAVDFGTNYALGKLAKSDGQGKPLNS